MEAMPPRDNTRSAEDAPQIEPPLEESSDDSAKAEAKEAKTGVANRGRKHSEETKAKIAAANRGRTHSEETKAKIAAAKRGRPRSEETKGKLRAANLGHKHSEETKAKLRGRPVSEKQRAHLAKYQRLASQRSAEARRGKPVSEAQLAILRLASQRQAAARRGKPGKPWSEAQKAKLRGRSYPGRRRILRWDAAKDALLGLSVQVSAEKRGVFQHTVYLVRRNMRFPKGYPGFYLHGEVLTGRLLKQFCEDVGLTQKQATDFIGIGRFNCSPAELDRPLSSKHPGDPNSPHRGRLLAAKIEEVIKRFCQGKPPRMAREFLKSEIRDIHQKHVLLKRAFGTLGEALRARQIAGDTPSIMEWVCEKATKELPSETAMLTMLRFGLRLEQMLIDKPELGDGKRASDFRPHQLANQILALDYRTDPGRIEAVIAGEVEEFREPRGLGQLILENSTPVRSKQRAAKPRKYGPDKKAASDHVWFEIGRRVEGLLDAGKSVEDAREQVRGNYEYDSIVRYHKKYKSWLRNQGK
jgi:hypothetical protein